MTNAYVLTGTLTDGRTLTLDEPLPAGAGRVRVTVEVLADGNKPGFHEVMERVWAGQRQRGHQPRPAEEIEAQIRDERESWGD